MNLTALLCVRNEDWVLGLSLRALLMFCDQVVVLLHNCTDRSYEIIEEVDREKPHAIMVMGDNHSGWDEMRLRQEMLKGARHFGATHLWLGDADEVLTGNLLPAIRKTVEETLRGNILQIPCYNLRGGVDRFHASGIWANRIVSTAFADVFDVGWFGDSYHRREPSGLFLAPYRPIRHGQGGILHLWGASERRLIAKHALYRITERLRWPTKPASEIERYYSMATDGRGTADCPRTWTFSPTPESWWEPYAGLMQHLHVDAEPWQEAECARLIAEHGIETFAGLRVRMEDFK